MLEKSISGMMRALLVRGMLVGLLAGLLGFGVAWMVGEPQVARAIAAEGHQHAMAGAAPESELVSRAVQSTIGLLTGVVAYSVALGGIFALVFAYAHGRLGRFGPRATAALLAAGAFTVLILAPQLKYPANPPSIGGPDTIGFRTGLYFGMLALSAAAAVAAFSTGRSLVGRLGTWNAALAGGAAYVVAIGIVMLVLPAVNELPHDFSAELVWRFRLASMAIQLVVWTVLGLGFGVAAERCLAGSRHPARSTRLAG